MDSSGSTSELCANHSFWQEFFHRLFAHRHIRSLPRLIVGPEFMPVTVATGSVEEELLAAAES
jgi:hypothetical protein